LAKYGSDGGELFRYLLDPKAYNYDPLGVEGCCDVDAARFAGALKSEVEGITGHVLQVRFAPEDEPSYTTGTKVVRILFTDKGHIKVREHTFWPHGGYYRRSRFYEYKCESGIRPIETSETSANSKASFGLTKVTVAGPDTKDDVLDVKSAKLDWEIAMKGDILQSNERMRVDAPDTDALTRLYAGGDRVSVEYYFATSPMKFATDEFELNLQEDRMESVVTVHMTNWKDVPEDASIEFEYTVYAGALAVLEWDDATQSLKVTPATTDGEALPALAEVYAFDDTVTCVSEAGSQIQIQTELDLALAWKKGKSPGEIMITGKAKGVGKCKKVVWDPTNADVGESAFEPLEGSTVLLLGDNGELLDAPEPEGDGHDHDQDHDDDHDDVEESSVGPLATLAVLAMLH
jgi:hypothetical protein